MELKELSEKLNIDGDAIWKKVQENRKRREGCPGHDFQINTPRPFRYTCKVCGCEEDSLFVTGYLQGLAHGKEACHEK